MSTLNSEQKNYTIGRGDLFFALKDPVTGALGGDRPIGNTTEFTITTSSTTLKHYAMSRGMRVQDREVPIQSDYEASFMTDDINPKNLAALFLGSASEVVITSASALNETFVGIEGGLSYQLGLSAGNPSGLRTVANVVVHKTTVGGTLAVLNTDYTVDTALGRVTPIQGSAVLVDGDSMYVAYDRVAGTQDRVASGSTVVDGALRLIAYNPEGKQIDYYMPAVKLSPNGAFAIKVENDWQKMPFKVSLSTPVNGSAIYADGRPF